MAAALVVMAGPVAARQTAKSPAHAQELAKLLDQAQLDSVAAKDPSQPDQFVAALYIAGIQLLVVSARYSAPTLLDTRITKKEYRDTYIDLSSASIPESKVFIQDGAADGLKASRHDNDPIDSFENGVRSISFDGDWKKQKLSEQEYMKSFAEADEQYAKMLQLLIAHLKGGTGERNEE
jgi:hypothetical protein